MKNLLQNEKGQVLLLVALMLIVLLGVAGLALEAGMAYGVKAKLTAAVDGAALAAGRAISPDTTAAKERARSFFYANCPEGLLGATIHEPTTTPVHHGDGSWTIDVEATADIPTKFARLVGWPTFTVAARSASTVRTLDMVLVLDTSKSLDTPNTTLKLLKDAVKTFVNNFDSSSNRVGMVYLASGAVVEVPLSTTTKTFDKEALVAAVNSLNVKGGTTSEEALRLAKEQLDSVPSLTRSSVRAIVFFTDGLPNGVVGKFNNGGTSVQGALYSEIDNSIDGARAKNAVPGGSGGPFRMYEPGRQDDFDAECNDGYNEGKNPTGYCKYITILPTKDRTNTINLESYHNRRPQLEYTATGNIKNTWCNVNKAARNMTENIANAARSEGIYPPDPNVNPIYIFTIGLGMTTPEVTATSCPDYMTNPGEPDSGENILRRLANDKGVDTYDPNQPTGMYVWASDAYQLQAAFYRIANLLLRLSE